MDTEIKNAVRAADREAQYDESAKRLLGNYRCDGNLNLLNIVMIGIADKLPEHDEKYELHRLLGALLSSELSEDEKLDIIETEYHIPLEEIAEMAEKVSKRCRLLLREKN